MKLPPNDIFFDVMPLTILCFLARSHMLNQNLFDECFNDNKPYKINTKFYEW